MIHHEIRRAGKHSFLDLYAPSTVLGFINRLAAKCDVLGGEFIIDRRGQTIGRTFSKLQISRYGSPINVAPMGFLKLVKSKRFNTRVASFRSQFPSLQYHGLLPNYFKVEFDVVQKGDREYLNVYAEPEVLAYVDNVAKRDFDEVFIGESIKGSGGSVVGRSYYMLVKDKCVKWEIPENEFEGTTQFVKKDKGQVREKVVNRLRGECLEYEDSMYAPKDFAKTLKTVLIPANIVKLPGIKQKIKDLKAVRDQESERANSLLICVDSLDALIQRNEQVNPLALKPKDFNMAWVSVSRLLGATSKLKRRLLGEQKRPLPSFALEGSKVYEKLKNVPWLGDKLKALRKKNLLPTLAFKADALLTSLTKKRNYLTSMIYLTEAETALFKAVRNKDLSSEDQAKKVAKIRKDLDRNLKHFLGSNLEKSFGRTLSRVFLQKYDILSEKYFRA